LAKSTFFSSQDLEAIQAATSAAEARTAGEIVPYITARAADHPDARWRGATLGALAATGLAALFETTGHLVVPWEITLALVLPAWIGAACGYFVVNLFPATIRFLLPDDLLEARVMRRAEAAFLHEEVFKTRDRTGILIFLALLEHRAVVLADSGIHAVVPKARWQQLADDLATGIRAGRAREALLATIEAAGALLVEHRLDIRPDDSNELSDAPRVHES
jgi:putative membrane protein